MLTFLTISFFTDSHQSPGRKTSLYGGDIKFTPKQRENMKKYGNPYGPQSRAASNVDSERWPNAVIPYTFDCSVGELFNRSFFKMTTHQETTHSRLLNFAHITRTQSGCVAV